MKSFYRQQKNSSPLRSAIAAVTVVCALLPYFSANARPIQIMPLGDSNTSGLMGTDSYRYFLWNMLAADGFTVSQIDFVGSNCGSGWGDVEPWQPCAPTAHTPTPENFWDWDHQGEIGTTPGGVLIELPSFLDLNLPDVVCIMLGTNDVIHSYNLDTATKRLADIIDTLRGRNPNVAMLLAQIPPLFPDDYNQVSLLNRKIANVAAAKTSVRSPVVLVDQNTGFVREDFGRDGIHLLDQTGNPKIAANWYDKLRPLLDSLRRGSVNIKNTPTVATRGDITPLTAISRARTGIKKVLFSVNSSIVGEASPLNDSTYVYSNWHAYPTGADTVRAIAIDNLDDSMTTAPLTIDVSAPQAQNLSIMAIRDTAPASPFAWRTVRTTGVVTAVRTDSMGFWVQDPQGDGNNRTSDAIKIDSRFFRSYHPETGDFIRVVGMVTTIQGARSQPSVCITPDSIVVVLKHQPLPFSVVVSGLFSDGPSFSWIRTVSPQNEGMLVNFVNAKAVAPTDSAGLWALVPAANAYSGISPRMLPVVSADNAALANYQPQIVAAGAQTLRAAPPQVRAGDLINRLTGVFDYDTGRAIFAVQPLPDSISAAPTVAIPPSPVSVRSAGDCSTRFATINFNGFFDTVAAPGAGEPVMSGSAFAIRVEKTVKAVTNELFSPAIMCVQGVENQGILDALCAAINGRTGKAYKAKSFQSTDSLGLRNGFIYDSSIAGLDTSFLLQTPNVARERQSLVGYFHIGAVNLAVVNVDFTGRGQDSRLFGPDWPLLRPSEALRMAQAQTVRFWLNTTLARIPGAPIMVAGQFNDNAFIEPGQTGANAVSIVDGTAHNDPLLLNAYDYLGPQAARFTGITEGRASMMAHLMVTPTLAGYASGVDVLHFNAGFQAAIASDSSTAVRVCDDDPVEIRF